MAMTLMEASKQGTGDVFRDSVIEMFAASTPLMGALPFMDVSGGSYNYNQEAQLPGVGFRGVNQGFDESTGILNPQTEVLRILGGDMDVDRAIIKFNGEDIRNLHESMKIKAAGLYFAKKFIKGDSVADPREFDGLMNRIGGSQLVEAGSTDGGDALGLTKVDELIDTVDEPTHLIMSKQLASLLKAAAHTTSVSGFITWDPDEFGKRVLRYGDLPILPVDYDDTGARVLDFNEVGSGGSTATATSMYCVSFGDGKLVGLQNGIMDVRDLGEVNDKPVMRTRIDWYVAVAALHGRCAGRLRGIKKAAVVA